MVTIGNDNRFFAKTLVGGREVMALLDSGAGACCIGKHALQFLTGYENSIINLTGQSVKTENGGKVFVVGIATFPVVWNGVSQDIDFLKVPGLEQEFYFGIDFWKTFNLPVVGESAVGRINVAEIVDTVEEDKKQHILSNDQKVRLEKAKLIFLSFAVQGLGRTSVEEHIIEVLNEDIPIKQRHYPVSPAIQELLYKELDRMISLGVIEPSNSSWSSPVTLVRKETKIRLCLDARKVNLRTIKDAYPLPHIEGILSRLQDTKFTSAIDLKDAFWQIPLEEKDSIHSPWAAIISVYSYAVWTV